MDKQKAICKHSGMLFSLNPFSFALRILTSCTGGCSIYPEITCGLQSWPHPQSLPDITYAFPRITSKRDWCSWNSLFKQKTDPKWSLKKDCKGDDSSQILWWIYGTEWCDKEMTMLSALHDDTVIVDNRNGKKTNVSLRIITRIWEQWTRLIRCSVIQLSTKGQVLVKEILLPPSKHCSAELLHSCSRRTILNTLSAT